QSHGLGRVAAKTLTYTLLASSISVFVGITLVNIVKPGAGFQLDSSMISSQADAVATIQSNAGKAQSLSEALVDLVPRNPIDSATRALTGEMLPLMVFALIFGLALSLVSRDEGGEGALVPFF